MTFSFISIMSFLITGSLKYVYAYTYIVMIRHGSKWLGSFCIDQCAITTQAVTKVFAGVCGLSGVIIWAPALLKQACARLSSHMADHVQVAPSHHMLNFHRAVKVLLLCMAKSFFSLTC